MLILFSSPEREYLRLRQLDGLRLRSVKHAHQWEYRKSNYTSISQVEECMAVDARESRTIKTLQSWHVVFITAILE